MSVSRDLPILIVDDYRTMLKLVRGVLTRLGFHDIDEATDGEAACDLMADKEYGLVISDWNMAPMSGIDLLKKLRAEAKTEKTPFIMITAEALAENVAAAHKAGVDSYIVKPFTEAVLKQRMSAVLGAL